MIYRNIDLDSLRTKLNVRVKFAEEEAVEIVKDSASWGTIIQRQALEAAVTKTGLERAANGGKSSEYGSVSPGRVDSGLMINSTNSHVEVNGNTAVGTWGWIDPEAYFAVQDWGTDTIPAAHSLLNSFISAREYFFSRVIEFARSKRA